MTGGTRGAEPTMAIEVQHPDRKRSARRTALWLSLLALAIYLGFIAMSVIRGS